MVGSDLTVLSFVHTLCHGMTVIWLHSHLSIIVHCVCDYYHTLRYDVNVIWLYSHFSIKVHCIMA